MCSSASNDAMISRLRSSSPVDYEKRFEWNTTLSLERLIERVGAFIHGIYVKIDQ